MTTSLLALKQHGVHDKAKLAGLWRHPKTSPLWDELDDLKKSALSLSGGQ